MNRADFRFMGVSSTGHFERTFNQVRTSSSGFVYLSCIELKFQSTFPAAYYIAYWKECYLDIHPPCIERNASPPKGEENKIWVKGNEQNG
jgi:hypothetical protein